MAANNMASILMGGDDDDSSDDENVLDAGLGSSVPVAASVPTSDDLSRLKSLYSTGNKCSNPLPSQQTSQNLPQQQQNRPSNVSAQSMEQTSRPSTMQEQSHQKQSQQKQSQQQNLQSQVQSTHTSRGSSVSSSSGSLMPSSHIQQAHNIHSQPNQPSPQISSRPLFPNRPREADPFEPTPLTTMISRHSSHIPPPALQQQHSSSESSANTIRTSNLGISHKVGQQSNILVQQPQGQVQQHHASSMQQPHQRHSSSILPIATSHSIPNQHQQPQQLRHQPSSNSGSHAPMAGNNQIPPASVTHSATSASHRAQQERDSKKAKDQFLMFTRVLMKYLESKDPNMHARAKLVIRDCAEKSKKKEQGYESVTSTMKKRLRDTVGEQYWARAEGYLKHFQQKFRDQKGTSGSSNAPASSSSMSQVPSQPQPVMSQSQVQAKPLSQQQSQQTMIQQQLAERQLAERRARDRAAELESQKRDLERKAASAAEEAIRKQKQQAAEKMREMQNMKAQTEQQRAHANHIVNNPNAISAIKRPVEPLGSVKRKLSSSSVSSTVNIPQSTIGRSIPARPATDTEVAPREYSELMEMLDHAVDYDWTTAGLLLDNKGDVDLNEEQRNLLYSNAPPKILNDSRIRRGWNDRNVLSARAAWAKVRLPEIHRENKESQSSTPIVAGVSLSNKDSNPSTIKTSWFNEDKAETDKTLALLSESMQIYLKRVLENALQCARQRENLDGIRLWHLQHNGSKPPISLRLGCDVSRQVALAAGNAALTVQRMEEALERNPSPKCDHDDFSILTEATCMEDLACRPKLAAGAQKAAYDAKRCFEISGGKDATVPPLGRIPKQAKILAQDINISMGLSNEGAPTMSSFRFL